MRLRTFCLALLMASFVLPTTPGAAQDDARPPWWPPHVEEPADFQQGWNLRIPLRVENPAPTTAPAGHPVQAHVDLGAAALEAGWPGGKGATGTFPRPFTALPDSLRVIEYSAGWGSILGPVPFEAFPRWFEPDQSGRYGRIQTDPFDATRNAVMTVEWLLPRPLPPFARADYYLYFEILQNSDKPAAELDPAELERLDGLYWVGRGTTFHGHHPGSNQDVPNLEIIGLRDGTKVTVYTYHGSPFPRVDDRPGSGNPSQPMTVNADEVEPYRLGVSPTRFMVQADKPVLVHAFSATPHASTSFIPSPDGGFTATRFLVPGHGKGILLIAPPQTPTGGASVQVRDGIGGSSLHDATIAPGSYTHYEFPADGFDKYFEVVSTAPVLVQYTPQSPNADTPLSHLGPAQIPSLSGSPVGQEFLAAAVIGQSGSPRFLVASHDAPAHVRIVDRTQPAWRVYADDVIVSPPPATALDFSTIKFHAAFESDGTTLFSPPVAVEARRGEGIPEDERGPIQLQDGVGDTSGQTNPYGGRHGIRVVALTPFAVLPHYDSTAISLTCESGCPPGGEPRRDIPSWDAHIPVDVSTGGRVIVESTKPVSVLPMPVKWPTGYTSFLGAKPAFLPTVVGVGEYRGYLVSVAAPGNADPFFVNGAPGQVVRVPFQVRNLGLWSDGQPLPDTVQLDVQATPTDWGGEARFRADRITLPTAAPGEGVLEITLPSTMPADASATFTVRATSEGNPNMTAQFNVVLSSRQVFDLGLWFGDNPSCSTCSSFESIRLPPGQTRDVDFVIKNRGTGLDTFQMDVPPPPGGWEVAVTDETGQPLTEVQLASGEHRVLALRVTAPSTTEVAEAIVTLDAFSEGSNGFVSSRLILLTRLSLGQGFALEATDAFPTVLPGESHVFNVDAINTGNESLSIELSIAHSLPEDWHVVFDGLGDPRNGPVSICPPTTCPGGASVRIPIRLTVPAEAPAGVLATFLLQGQGTGDQKDVRDGIGLGTTVGAVHDVRVTDVARQTAPPGGTVNFTLEATNHGNTPELLRVRPFSLPGGWDADVPQNPALASAGETVEIPIGVAVRPAHPAGTEDIDLVIYAGHPEPSVVTIPVDVQTVHMFEWEAAPGALARPGETIVRAVRLQNTGNIADDVTVDVAAPVGWDATSRPAQSTVPPGSSVVAEVTIRVPDDPLASSVKLTLRARSLAANQIATIDLPVQIERAHLTLKELGVPSAAASGGTVLVIGVLHNEGRVPATEVEARLVAGDEILDAVQFDSIGPEGTVVAALRWTITDQTADAAFVWGQGPDASAFREEGRRQLQPSAPADAQDGAGAPGPGIAPVIFYVVAVAAMLAARRRRFQEERRWD